MKSKLNKLLLVLMTLLVVGCGAGTTSVGNPKLISVGKVENNSSQITIPLDSLGIGEALLGNVSISVLKNGALLTDIAAQNNFNDPQDAIIFNISPVALGDTITLIIKGLPGGDLTFASILSDQNQQQSPVDCNNSNNEAVLLVCSLCDAIIACEPQLESSRCLSGLLQDTQLPDNFGVPPQDAISMQGLADGITDGTYTAQSIEFNQCLLDLSLVNCTQVNTNYSFSDPDNFINIENLVPENPASCGAIF